MVYAYKLSEEIELPVIVRTTTRVSHMRGPVTLGEMPKLEEEYAPGEYWPRGHLKKSKSICTSTCKCTRYAHSTCKQD